MRIRGRLWLLSFLAMTLRSDLAELFGSAFTEIGLDPAFGDVVPSQRPDLGQFQCNGAMSAARAAKRAPREIAGDVVALVESDPRIADLEVAGPGFINITLTDEYLVATGAAGVPLKSLCAMVINAAKAAFLPESEKTRLVEWFSKAMSKYTSGIFSDTL